MLNLGFIPLRLVPYAIAGVSALVAIAGTLLVEHKVLPMLAKDDGKAEPDAA